MNHFVAQVPAENILATSFKKRAAKIDKLTEQQRADFQSRVEVGDRRQGLSRVSKIDLILQCASAQNDDG